MSINNSHVDNNVQGPVKQKTVFDKLKAFDLYRKLPSDMVQPTYSGALSKIT